MRNKKEARFSEAMKQSHYDNVRFTGRWIPKGFLFIDELSFTDLNLLTIIKDYNTNTGAFEGSNKYLALQMGLSEARISQMIANFRDLKLIYTTEEKYMDAAEGLKTKRRIYITNITKILSAGTHMLINKTLIDLRDALIDLSGDLIDYEYNIISSIILDSKSIINNTTSFSKTKTTSFEEPTKKDFPTNELIEFWNELGVGAKHKDTSTKVYKNTALTFSRMLKGQFLEKINTIDLNFLKQYSIDYDIIKKKWGVEEIKSILTAMAKFMKDNEGTYDAKKMKTYSLMDLLYNYNTKKSYFLKFACGKEKQTTIRDKAIFKKYKDFMGDQLKTKEQENMMASAVNGLYDEVFKIYKKVEKYYRHTSFSSYLGSSTNPMPFFDQHIAYLKIRNTVNTNMIKVDSYCWCDFIKFLEKKYTLFLNPTPAQIKQLKIEVERSERYHNRLKQQRGE